MHSFFCSIRCFEWLWLYIGRGMLLITDYSLTITVFFLYNQQTGKLIIGTASTLR